MGRLSLEEYRDPAADATLEDDWIEEAEGAPGEAGWFVATAQALVSEGEPDRARELLELWDSELAARSLWSVRLDALRRVGALLFKPSRLQREVISTFEALFVGKPSLQVMIDYVGLKRPVDDPAKLWDRATRLSSLLVFDVGEIVVMQGQGVGRVVEVNLSLETLKIDFDKRSGVTLGFRAAAKMLRPLPAGHLLRRKLEDPDSLEREKSERPEELLRAVLEGSEQPRSAGEIREALAGVVTESEWPAFWAAVKRHPQLVAIGSGRQTYRWEASAGGALDALRQSFARAPARKRLEIFRRSVERDAALADELAAALASMAGTLRGSDPGMVWEIVHALERASRLPPSLAAVAHSLIVDPSDLKLLLTGIADRGLRERALAIVRSQRTDWLAQYREQFLREDDSRVLSLLADALAAADRALLDRTLDDLVVQPRRAKAAFVWLAERAGEDELLRGRAPLRILQQIFFALGDDEFSAYRARLRALAESGGTIPRLLAVLDPEQAPAALDAILRASGLEPYQREPLATALRLRFSGLAESSTAGPLYSTAKAIASKRAELARLTEIEIPANRKAIEEARAMGDLRENFEYKSARQRHEYLNSRVAILHGELGRARPIDFALLDTSEVRIGARVRLLALDGRERSFAVLGPWDSRPETGIVSYESELGQRLLGAHSGDEVSVGDSKFRVLAIEPAG